MQGSRAATCGERTFSTENRQCNDEKDAAPPSRIVDSLIAADATYPLRMTMKDILQNLGRELATDERGATLADYTVLLALIVVSTLAAVSLLGETVTGVINAAVSNLGTAK